MALGSLLADLARRMAEMNIAPQQIAKQIAPQQSVGELAQPQAQPVSQRLDVRGNPVPQRSQQRVGDVMNPAKSDGSINRPGQPQNAGTPGEVRKGADGLMYMWGEQTGMAGAKGPQGWIRYNDGSAQGAQPAQAPQAPVDPNKQLKAQGDDKLSNREIALNTWRNNGVTNPFGLAALAATGTEESGFSNANLARTWSDPSESGGQGTSGGMFSWRNERLNALQSFAKEAGQTGNGSTENQALFYVKERPNVIAALNKAGSMEEAMAIMNNDIAFAGHDRKGGEAAARLETARSILPDVQAMVRPPGFSPPMSLSGIGSPNVGTGSKGTGVQNSQLASYAPGTQPTVAATTGTGAGKPETFADRLAKVGQAIDPTAFKPPELPGGNAPLPNTMGAFNRQPENIAMILQMLGGGNKTVPQVTPTLAQLMGG